MGNDNLFCSFCGKNQPEVKYLIAGPAVYICNECTELCHDILIDEGYVPDPNAVAENPVKIDHARELAAEITKSLPIGIMKDLYEYDKLAIEDYIYNKLKRKGAELRKTVMRRERALKSVSSPLPKPKY